MNLAWYFYLQCYFSCFAGLFSNSQVYFLLVGYFLINPDNSIVLFISLTYGEKNPQYHC